MINFSETRSRVSKVPGSNVFGRYRLIANVGRGGMADVYLAVTESPEARAQFQKLLVIKMLKRELCEDADFVRMFLDEARLAARLNHPNVVQTIEVCEAGGRYFLAMEFLEGQPLHRVLRNTQTRMELDVGTRLYILGQALSGLQHAHERRDYDGSRLDIVHRDFSPANLFVTYDGLIKLMDFGIAKARDSTSETRVGVVKGKAAYISPEQARGELVDRRADIYSAGVVLWELVTDRRLWSGLTQLQMLRRVISGDVPSPRSIDPRIAPELERICMKALAAKPEDRYATASEFARELELFAQDSYPPVVGRDLGGMIALAFTEDRDRIREVIEARLSNPPMPEASLPELHPMTDTGKTPSQRELPEGGESSGTQEARRKSRKPESPDGAARAWRDMRRKLALIGIAAMLVGGTAAALFGNSGRASEPPPPAEPKVVQLRSVARGVTEQEIKIGMSAVFSGPSRELGQNMKLGVETSFQAANAAGGIHGRKLTLTALDDGYEAARASVTMKELVDERGVFAIVGNVGTPTSVVAAPFAAKRKTIFFGAFTGAPVLRQDPPDRYVFNYRASYKEETAKSVKFLLDVQRFSPQQIVVFAQEDSYGDAGFEGVTKALRAQGHADVETLRVGYKRNTADVDAAVSSVMKYVRNTDASAATGSSAAEQGEKRSVKAIVMIATYRAAAKFIQRIRSFPRMQNTLFMNVSFVGSETLAEELKSANPALCSNVYVTQVVPPFDSGATGVLRYRQQLAMYQSQAQPGFVSLEGFIVGSIFVEALKRAGPDLSTEKFVDTLEQIQGLDLGFGTTIAYSLSEHQGSHKVWGTRLDETCTYAAVDLD
jgi:serine/threonine protein kinase/ABC-type branched-subunit amino acid transport system substrate-binding protein